MERNNELRTAWDFVENTGRSIFLTGKAGTGKTTFLKTVVERSRKRSVVVAPTGVAAINAGGVTIHSFFQLPLSPYVPGATTTPTPRPGSARTQADPGRRKFDFSKEKRKIIASLDLLIIDEISMVRADLLDAIDDVMRRYRNHFEPFGGVQLLMIGDLAQLTPVVTPEDERLLKPHYDTPYFFGSKALAQTEYVTIQLEKVYRQQDDTFLTLLNHIREGNPSPEDLQLLNSRYRSMGPMSPIGPMSPMSPISPISPISPMGPTPFIRLTTHNQMANFYNEDELRRLPGRSFSFSAKVEGTFPDYAYPTAYTLVLKVGAQVMFVKNDVSGKHRYYNGRIGHVTYVDQKKILVLCEGDSEAIDVERIEWENARYTLNPETREIVTDVQGTFTQFPLRLAWAITIHKSQGLTFDHAIIDANQSFAPGQVYVALSRCRTLEGMVLSAPIEARAIINDQRVDSYIARQEQAAQQSIGQLPMLKKEYSRHLLLELFDLHAVVQQQEQMVRLFGQYFYSSHQDLARLHGQTLQELQHQGLSVAEKWRTAIRQMTTDQLLEQTFLDRVRRSADYFAQTLAMMEKPLQLSAAVKTNNKQAMNRLKDALTETRQTWLAKRCVMMKIAGQGFTVDIYLKEKQMATLDALDEKKPRQSKEREYTHDVSFRMFAQGMTIAQIAQERSIAASTVFSHLAHFVEAGTLDIQKIIPQDRLQTIERIVHMVGTEQGSTPVKALCPPDVSYSEINLVMRMMKPKTQAEG